MRKIKVFITVSLIFMLFPIQDLKADISMQTDIYSSYIWRGFDLNPYRKPVFQPSINYLFGSSGFSLELWSSLSFENKELTEMNFTFSYESMVSDRFLVSAGIIHYGWYFAPNFQFKENTSHEVFFSVGLPEMILDPALTIFYDFTNGGGIYIQMETNYSIQLLESIGAEFYGSLGYNGGQWLAEGVDPGLSDLNLGLSFPINIGRFCLSPSAFYTIVLMDAIGKDNFFWYGITLSFD